MDYRFDDALPTLRRTPAVLRNLVLGWLVVSAIGCATGGSSGSGSGDRAPSETPDQFQVLDGGTPRPARAGEGCRNPMVDPRDQTRLELIRSDKGFGDYKVPPGRYGVRAGFLLRLDCANGAAVAIVRGR